jgi:UDP-N-acetylglucosamine transferase subunit ALG13
MIFVSIGTSEPFDRLLEAVDRLDSAEKLVVQIGTSTTRPIGATCVEFLDFDETLALMRQARVVITHAGVGSVLTALKAGKRPILVPRLGRFGEAIDDHQLLFARRVEDAGLGTAVEDLTELGVLVDAVDPLVVPDTINARELAIDLRNYLEAVVGAPRRAGETGGGR